MSTADCWAHSQNDDGVPQFLLEHLTNVQALTARFAQTFDAGDLAAWAGFWHDIGKLHQTFQQYLKGISQAGREHKMAGVILAQRHAPLLAAIIAGHHGGLPAYSTLKAKLLDADCCEAAQHIIQCADQLHIQVHPATPITLPAWLTEHDSDVRLRRRSEFFTRILFSALVDADFLDTERHFERRRAVLRPPRVVLADIWLKLEQYEQQLAARSSGDLNAIRQEILEQCVAAADRPPGIFRLTVPTGGGKTLSGLSFALRHALLHGLQRVIFAAPYTSIIEQTADVYRRVLGDAAVLEHHSAVQQQDEAEGTRGQSEWARLAAENWDVPVVVTTNVQLFESLFANAPSRCRKLHRIAGSVIVLDETQTLPPALLVPILDVLNELVAHYRVTVVFCTATQPALEDPQLACRIPNAPEIVPDPARYFRLLRRVQYEILGQPIGWDDVAGRMRRYEQVMAVVNTKKDALALMAALDDPAALHLSSLLCGAHRRVILRELRQRLSSGVPCRLVSTQVIEAGVDIDFPVVLRAVGPLDRIVQAAGRCNREGRLPDAGGKCIVFEPAEGGLPRGAYQSATAIARQLLREPEVDLNDPSIFTRYFSELWAMVETEGRHVQEARQRFDFPRVAELFQLITDDTTPVVVHYDDSVGEIIAQLKSGYVNARPLVRQLQPYIVSLHSRTIPRLEREQLVAPIIAGLYEWLGRYDNRTGIVLNVNSETVHS